jgi:hypothetical protein
VAAIAIDGIRPTPRDGLFDIRRSPSSFDFHNQM